MSISHEKADMGRVMRKHVVACENKDSDQLRAVTAELISAFVYSSKIVQVKPSAS